MQSLLLGVDLQVFLSQHGAHTAGPAAVGLHGSRERVGWVESGARRQVQAGAFLRQPKGCGAGSGAPGAQAVSLTSRRFLGDLAETTLGALDYQVKGDPGPHSPHSGVSGS